MVVVAFLMTVPLLERHIFEDRLPSASIDQLKAYVVVIVSRTPVCLLWTASCPFVNSLINLLHCPN